MKAKEYCAKYSEALLSSDEETHTNALSGLIKDFCDETLELLKTRHAVSDKACLAIVDEMNGRWNALAEMLPIPILKRNGWKEYFMACLSRSATPA